jgi:hypothetical protein
MKIPLVMIARSIRFRQYSVERTACWIWTGPIDSANRGQAVVCLGGETMSARRAIYRSLRGHEPEGRLFNRCQIKLCVNPHHVIAK